MKKILILLLFPVSLLFISCEGDQGPPGFDGEDGIDILGAVFEANVDLNVGNGFSAVIDFPNSIEVFETDIVVAYILTDTEDGLDVWEPLPQTLFFDDGIVHYTYDYTLGGVAFHLDGTVILENLSTDFTQNVIFRVAVIPADDAQNIDLNSYENVINSLQNSDLVRLN